MNKQIAKLAKQAGYNPSWDTKADREEYFDIAEFAELIVQECAGIYSKIDDGNLHMATDDYLEALHKTFFGVEE